MKTIFKVFVLAAIPLSFMACTHKGLDYRHGKTALEVYAGVGTVTKAHDAVWDSGDQIGVIAGSPLSTTYQNALYTLSTGDGTNTATFTASGNNVIYFTSDDEVSFTAYGPYQTTTSVATLPGTSGVVTSTTTAQSSDDTQKDFDFIFASSRTASEASPIVNFSFYHKMVKIIVNVKAGDDQYLTNVQGAAYSLKGLAQTGSFNVTDGTATATSTAADWTISTNWVKSTLYDEDDTEKEVGVTYTGIIFPQTPTTFTFSADDLGLTGDLHIPASTDSDNPTEANGFVSGYSYTYNVTVNESSVVVGGDLSGSDGGTGNIINDWTDGPDGDDYNSTIG